MAPPHTQKSPEKQGRIDLALHGIKKNQFSSQRKAAEVCKVPRSTMRGQLHGATPREESRPQNSLLLLVEEEQLIQWILAMEQRGFPTYLIDVKRMAENLILHRGTSGFIPKIGINWVYRFTGRHPAIKKYRTRNKDYRRARQERLSVIQPWFQLIQDTKEKYGIIDADTYNFDETGFAQGVITGSATKAVGSSDNTTRITISQPGDRTWTTAIECACAQGWILPPFIILPGKDHLLKWYKGIVMPIGTIIEVSINGWTNDELGLQWIKHFDKHTRGRAVGTHRLLILDGHGSHATPEFDCFCKDNRIITICMPPHSSHILQPLDVGCFSPLKSAYGRLVADLARRQIFHVDKPEFLEMYLQARASIFSEKTIKNAFKATGIVPFNPNYVLSKLIATPSPPGSSHGQASPIWTSETPRTVRQVAQQEQLIKKAIQRASQSPTGLISKLTKAATQMIVQATLTQRYIAELQSTIEHQNKKKRRTKARVQVESGMTVEEVQERIVRDELLAEITTEARSQRAPRMCGNCRQIGHNRRRCPDA
jgi:DDE superfamily endonuclease/Tc5 transposase DNA-binding domain